MIVKSGKFGKFLACPSYPECKTTMSMPSNEEPKLVGKCPECGAAMTVRKSQRGKVYYSCSGYPDCKFMSWDIPTGEKCPDCNSALVKVGRSGVKCSNKDCSYRVGGSLGGAGSEKTKKGVEIAPDYVSVFEAPPMDFEESGGYIYEGVEDDV